MNHDVLDTHFKAETEAYERFRALCPNSDHDRVSRSDLGTLLSQRDKWLGVLGEEHYAAVMQTHIHALMGEA